MHKVAAAGRPAPAAERHVAMADNPVSRFLGGSPLRVALQLLFLCFVVGVILSALNINPWDLYRGTRAFVLNIVNMGFGAVERFGGYILLGAVVVLPVWLILRVLNATRR